MDLVRSLDALQHSSLAAQSSAHQDEEQVATQYNLLLKVADPRGTARAIPIHAVRLELQTAWGDSYTAVSEVLRNLFLASFDNPATMMFVVKRQPWIVHRHNLQIEIVDPQKNELFVAARAKINVTRKATDKVFIPISDTRTIIVFVHYTKIQTICSYCAGFFHDCHARTSTVLVATPSGEQRPTPFQLHGAWMCQLSEIPMDFVTRQITSVASDGAQPSSLLSNLRSTFAAPSSALGPGPSASRRLIQPDPPQQQFCNHSPWSLWLLPLLSSRRAPRHLVMTRRWKIAMRSQIRLQMQDRSTKLHSNSRKEESTFRTRWRCFSTMALST
jgi:hypothetical protein